MGNRGLGVGGSCNFDLSRSSDPLSVFAVHTFDGTHGGGYP